MRAYRFTLAPSAGQEKGLLSHCGAARFAFNTMLVAVKTNLDQRATEKTYGIDDDDLTPSPGWSFYTLQKEWNRRKPVVAPWWSENGKHSYSSGCRDHADALSSR